MEVVYGDFAPVAVMLPAREVTEEELNQLLEDSMPDDEKVARKEALKQHIRYDKVLEKLNKKVSMDMPVKSKSTIVRPTPKPIEVIR